MWPRLFAPLLAAVAFTLSFGPAELAKASEPDARQKILTERYETALKIQDLTQKLYDHGLRDYLALLKAARRVLEADLARKTKLADQIAIHDKLVAVARQKETFFEKIVQEDPHGPTSTDLLEARYDRLTAELELQKLKDAPRK